MSELKNIQLRRKRLLARCYMQRAALQADMAPLMQDVDTVDYWIGKLKRYGRVILAVSTITTIVIARRPRSLGGIWRGLRFVMPGVLPTIMPYAVKLFQKDRSS